MSLLLPHIAHNLKKKSDIGSITIMHLTALALPVASHEQKSTKMGILLDKLSYSNILLVENCLVEDCQSMKSLPPRVLFIFT